MDLTDAARMILGETVALPKLARVSRHVYDESSIGRTVPHATLSWMLREAGLQGVINVLDKKHGGTVARDVILLLSQEIDRSALVG